MPMPAPLRRPLAGRPRPRSSAQHRRSRAESKGSTSYDRTPESVGPTRRGAFDPGSLPFRPCSVYPEERKAGNEKSIMKEVVMEPMKTVSMDKRGQPEFSDEDDARARAVERLRKRAEFHRHLLVYILVNAFIVAIWVMTSEGGFFWPIFPIAGWGIGLAMHALDAYGRPAVTEDRIQREMERET